MKTMGKIRYGVLLFICFYTFLRPGAPAEENPRTVETLFLRMIHLALQRFESAHDLPFLEKALYFGEIKSAWLYWSNSRRVPAKSSYGRDRCPDETVLIRLLGRYVLALQEQQGDRVFRELDEELARLSRRCLASDGDEEGTAAASPLRMKDLNLREIQGKLPPSGMIIRYILLPERIVSVVISDHAVDTVELPVDTSDTVKLINRLTEPLDDFSRGRVDYLRIHFDLGLAHRLYEILLQNVLANYPAKTDIYLIPDKELFKLPFEALVVGFNKNELRPEVLFSEYESADYLIQSRSVSYYLSLSDFQKRFSPPRASKWMLSAFGNPVVPVGDKGNGNSSSGPNDLHIGEISSTEVEILALQKFFPPGVVQIFLNDQCNERNFEAVAPDSRLIHIATHFFCDTEEPRDSAFLFSSRGREIPFYHSRRIFHLRLRAELVILSACETSESRLLEMKMVKGVTAAFRHSGVRSLMVSLWPVDEYNSQIVPLFYEDFLKSGDAARSLRESKLALIKKVIPLKDGISLSFAHPFLWANYVLYHFYRPPS